MHGHCTADVHFIFAYAKCRFSHDAAPMESENNAYSFPPGQEQQQHKKTYSQGRTQCGLWRIFPLFLAAKGPSGCNITSYNDME